LQLAAPVATHWVAGTGAVAAGTLAQVPGLALSAHDWQVPVQALMQQTPCWQKPEAHSSAVVQVVPGVLRAQEPVLQTYGETQSASAVQVVLHAVALPHVRFPAQPPIVAGLHSPAPSQVWADVNVETEQDGAAHCVPLTNLRQAPVPLQVPSVPQVEAAVTAHWAAGVGS